MADYSDKHDKLSGKHYTKFITNFQRLLAAVNDARKGDNTRLDALEKLIQWIAVIHFHGLPKPLFQQVIHALISSFPGMPLLFVEEWQAMFDCFDLCLYRIKSLGKRWENYAAFVYHIQYYYQSSRAEKLIEIVSESDAALQNNPLCAELLVKLVTRAILCLPQHAFSAYLTVKMLIHCALLRPLSILRRAGLEGIKALYVAKTGCDDVVELNSAVRALSVGEGKAYRAVVCRIKRDESPKLDRRFQMVHWWLDKGDFGEDANWMREAGDEFLVRCVRESAYWGTSSNPSARTVTSAGPKKVTGTQKTEVKQVRSRVSTAKSALIEKPRPRERKAPIVPEPVPSSTHTSNTSLSTYVVEMDKVEPVRPQKSQPKATHAGWSEKQQSLSSPEHNAAADIPALVQERKVKKNNQVPSLDSQTDQQLPLPDKPEIPRSQRKQKGVPKGSTLPFDSRPVSFHPASLVFVVADDTEPQTESIQKSEKTTPIAHVSRSLPLLGIPMPGFQVTHEPAQARRSDTSFMTSHTARVQNQTVSRNVHLPLIPSVDKTPTNGANPVRCRGDSNVVCPASPVTYKQAPQSRSVSPGTVSVETNAPEKKISTLMEKLRLTSAESASSWSTSDRSGPPPCTVMNRHPPPNQAVLLETLNKTQRIEPSVQITRQEEITMEYSSVPSVSKEPSVSDSFYLSAAKNGAKKTLQETQVISSQSPSFNRALFAEVESEASEDKPIFLEKQKPKNSKSSPFEEPQGKKPEEVRAELQLLLDRMQRGARHSSDIVLAVDEFVRLTENYPKVVENAIGLVFSQFLPLVCSLNSHVAAEAVAALELLMPAVESRLHLVASQIVEALCNNMQNARTSDHSKKVFNQFLGLQVDRAGGLLPPLASHIGTMMKKNKKEAFGFVITKYAETLRRAYPKQPKNQAAAVQVLQFVKSVLVWITNYGEVHSSSKPEIQAVDVLIQESVKAFGLEMLNKVCFDYRDTVKLFLSRHNQTVAVPAVASCGPTLQKVVVRRSSLMAFKKRLK